MEITVRGIYQPRGQFELPRSAGNQSGIKNKPLSASKTQKLTPVSTFQLTPVMPAQAGIHREFHLRWESSSTPKTIKNRLFNSRLDSRFHGNDRLCRFRD
jgi:hypothetical protein